jgi:hypothetical protein
MVSVRIKMNQSADISTDQLLLDIENPRFGLVDAADQLEALRILKNRANLKELWDSISQKGFQRFEPLVAIKDPASLGYIVIEGNRRLAAVKLLLDPDLAQLIGLKAMPSVTPEVAMTLHALPVNVVASRNDAAEYIGFKHINGPTTWGSLAKAKFANKLYEATKLEFVDAESALDVLSKRLGDGRQLLLRILIGYKVFEQARDFEFMDEQKLFENTLDFSHLYTMLQNPDTRKYLGLGESPLKEDQIVKHPIPASHTESLRNIVSWLFGDSLNDPVIRRQGTDRPKLTKVLASSSATKVLEDTRDFARAVEESDFDKDLWVTNVAKLELLANNVKNSISDLPSTLDPADIEKSLERLEKTGKHVTLAVVSVKTLFDK